MNIPEPKYCIVNSINVLWTCHKACNIEFGDCDYHICSKCYLGEIVGPSNNHTTNVHRTSKRHPLVRSIDDDNTIYCHDIGSLVPFMKKIFYQKIQRDDRGKTICFANELFLM